MKILNNKLKILKLSIILLISITIIIILNSNIKLFQSDDYIFLKIFQKTNNENKIDYNKKESEENYIFKVEADGTTKYQKDYSKSVKNLIESAYFTMKGDKLINSAKAAGETTAVKKLKNTLASTKKGGSKQTINNRTATPLWELTSKQLRKPSR